MKFFEGWIKLFNDRKVNKDLETWARIEYNRDAAYAYNHLITYGVPPHAGAR